MVKMKQIDLYITEKLIINKDSQQKKSKSTDKVIIFDLLKDKYGHATGYDLSLFITGLIRINEDNNDCQNIQIICYKENKYKNIYRLYKPNKNPDLIIAKGDSELSLCEIILYTTHSKDEEICENIVDPAIDKLNKWKKKRKYVRMLLEDDIQYDFDYMYMWYSEISESITILLSNLDYKTLYNKDTFI